MKKIIYFIFFISLFTSNIYGSDTLYSTTPTERFLEDHSLTDIQDYYNYYNKDIEDNIPLFLKMINNEKQKGFFGYHGSTQNYRIFQDIIRAVLEEIFDYDLPEDFYFLRTPGTTWFDIENDKQTFYDMFDRDNNDKETQDLLIDFFILQPARDELNLDLTINNLNKQDRAIFMSFFDDAANRLSELRVDVVELGIKTPLLQHHILKKIQGTQNEKYKKALINTLFNLRHQSNEQSTIKFTDFQSKIHAKNILTILKRLEQEGNSSFNGELNLNWLNEKLKTDTIIDRCLESWDPDLGNKISKYFYPLWDTNALQKWRLVCLNIPLFGNYHRLGESTLSIFLEGQSIENGDRATIFFLMYWFDEIGLKMDVLNSLEEIAKNELSTQDKSQGCIFQFFDLSESPYELLDKTCFVSYPFGVPARDAAPSDILLTKKPLNYKSNHNGILQRQLRFVTSNKSTLNPFSNLRIKRYDCFGKEVEQFINMKLRKRLSEAKVDKQKVKTYKEKLDKLWNLEGSKPS